jgi:uridylate kinase
VTDPDPPSGESVTQPAYRRVLLKLSGEILAGERGFGLHRPTIRSIADQIRRTRDLGCEIAVVVGGGNIFRGKQAQEDGVGHAAADTMGMVSTVINALALQGQLENLGVFTRVLSAIHMDQVCEPYIRRRAIRHLEKGRIVILAGGTGNPYFTTDTAAVLRAVEIHSDVVLKGTRVDGVYSADPEKDASAELFTEITFREALERQLRIMDLTALTLCMENRLPIVVFNIKEEGNLERLLRGEKIGTWVHLGQQGEVGR